MITSQQTLTALETKIATEKGLILDYINKVKNKQQVDANIESQLDIFKEVFKALKENHQIIQTTQQTVCIFRVFINIIR